MLSKTIEIAEILKENGVNLSEIALSKTVNGKTKYYTLGEISQEGINIERIIKDNGILKKGNDYG